MSVQKEKIIIQQLQFGMFIAELDRPWLESPFLLQGFVLENEQQMQALQSLCQHVYVDRTKSVGDQFGARANLDVSIKRTGFSSYTTTTSAKNKQRASNAPTIVVKTPNSQQKTIQQSSFFEIMSAIKNGDVSETEEGIIFNLRTVAPESSMASDNSEATPREQKEGAFAFFKNLFKKKQSFSDTLNGQDDDKDADGVDVRIYEDAAPRVEQEMAVIYPTFEKSQQSIKKLFESIANAQKLDLSTVSEILDSMVDSISRTPDALMWLAKLKSTHDVAYSHALNVSINAMAFASFLAMPKNQIKEIGLGGLLQDVGKVSLPKHILEKTSALTIKEYELAKSHIAEGLKLLKNNADIPTTAIQMVGSHHERFDGSGYPNGLINDAISIHGQIAGMIDTYCALTTERSYARSMHNMKALDEIRLMRDKEFSSELVDQLIQFLGIYPVSSLVELNTGEVAVVIQQNQVRRLLPRVMLILAEDKSKYKYPITLDLLNAPQAPTGETYRIVKGLASDSYGLNADEFYL